MKGKIKKIGVAILCAFAVLLWLYSMINGGGDGVSAMLKLCAEKLVPSIFVSVCFSSFVTESGLWRFFAKPVSKLFGYCFGFSAAGSAAFAVGILCGFPSGAVCVSGLYSGGELKKEEAEKLLSLCALPSPAFFISFIGSGIYGAPIIGAGIYLCVLTGTFVISALLSVDAVDDIPFKKARLKDPVSSICAAVASGVEKTLTACGFVTVFGLCSSTISAVFSDVIYKAATCSFFEITGAVIASEKLPMPYSMVICAAAVGFSGLSAYCQIFFCAEKAGLIPKNYFSVKLCTGALSALNASVLGFCQFFTVVAFFAVCLSFTVFGNNLIYSRKRKKSAENPFQNVSA